MPIATRLPIITIDGRQFYVDHRLNECRAVDNPHERCEIPDPLPPLVKEEEIPTIEGKEVARRLIERFGEANVPVHNNCLLNKMCPHCGSREALCIDFRQMARVTDNGLDFYGDSDYDRTCYCRCDACDYDGRVADFEFYGLDEALTENLNDTLTENYATPNPER